MYRFVHQELKVPFQNGKSPGAPTNDGEEQAGSNKWVTMGSYISRIYFAIRDGERYAPAMDCLREILAEAPRTKSGCN